MKKIAEWIRKHANTIMAVCAVVGALTAVIGLVIAMQFKARGKVISPERAAPPYVLRNHETQICTNAAGEFDITEQCGVGTQYTVTDVTGRILGTLQITAIRSGLNEFRYVPTGIAEPAAALIPPGKDG